jgi:cyclopropane-fatty-acyl-phospholipid synthase
MSAYHPGLIKKPIAHGTNLLPGALGSVSWPPVLCLSKAAITSLFARIEHGTLIVIDEASWQDRGIRTEDCERA